MRLGSSGPTVPISSLNAVAPGFIDTDMTKGMKATAQASPGVQIVALDTTLDTQRYGELFDFVVGVQGLAGK